MNFWIELKTWFALKLDIRNPKDLQRCIELSFAKGIAEAQVRAQRFLLEQAPMIDAPTPLFARQLLSKSVTRFGYMHPETMKKLKPLAGRIRNGQSFVNFPGSPTDWVLTDLMPEDRVIYSPNAIPGIKP